MAKAKAKSQPVGKKVARTRASALAGRGDAAEHAEPRIGDSRKAVQQPRIARPHQPEGAHRGSGGDARDARDRGARHRDARRARRRARAEAEPAGRRSQRRPRPLRLLHHPREPAAEVRRDRHGRAVARRLHDQLQGHGGRRLRRADRAARFDARERAGARARQRDGDARSHGHPDVVRHDLQDARGHRRAAAVGLRRVCRRAQQDAGQARVRSEGAVGSRRDRARRSSRRTRTSTG